MDGERRHLTILFCDLVGSTEISFGLDPEEWWKILGAYRLAVSQAAMRHGGHVAHYIGDGLLVYFGYPRAREGDAERAVRAGLAIVDAVTALDARIAVKRGLEVRVGVHAGPVAIARQAEKPAFGEAVTVAESVQALAEPDTVTITAAVDRMVAGLFVTEPSGSYLAPPGKPVELYRVIRASGARSSIHAAAIANRLTPLVGREDEAELLRQQWRRAWEGNGRVVIMVGEAGVGKSRVVEQFRRELADTRHWWVECAARAFLQETPFHPLVACVEDAFRFDPGQSPEQRVRTVEGSLERIGVKLSPARPLADLLKQLCVAASNAQPEDQPRCRAISEVMVACLSAAAAVQPLVCVIEDLQWMDSSTLEVLRLAAGRCARIPMLMLMTARPEFRGSVGSDPVRIRLGRLTDKQIRRMIGQIPAGWEIPAALAERIIERSAGVPLFAEALTRFAVEQGGRLPERTIPMALRERLAARLDRLGAAREVARIGAVIGIEFSYEQMAALSPISGAELRSALDRLVDEELLEVRGVPPRATYFFKHEMVRDAAYESVLISTRRELLGKLALTRAENRIARPTRS